jgi:hypothetical protein
LSRDAGEAEAARRVKKAWDDAEDKLKRTERINGALTVPAVNELRYAGYHALEAVTAASPEEAHLQYEKAEKHCKRAAYDAVEAEILFHFAALKQFQDDYRLVQIDIPGVDYQGIRRQANEARKLVSEARRSDETRDDYYARILPHCDQLASGVEDLTVARDELNKKVATLRKVDDERGEDLSIADKREGATTRRWLGTTILAFLAFTLAGWTAYRSLSATTAAPPPTVKTTK